MNKLIVLVSLLLIGTSAQSQQKKEIQPDPLLNSLQFNFAGDASMFALQYDRLYPVGRSLKWSAKLGFGVNEEFDLCIWGNCDEPETYITLPHHFTAIIGSGRHTLELGLGGTLLIGNTTQPYFFYPMFGYRLLALESKRFTMRVFVQAPLSGFSTDDILFSPIGLSLGFGF